MLEKAEIVLRDVESQFRISHVVGAFSGGNDSVVACHWAMNRFPECVAMIARTQIGLKAAVKHQDNVCEILKWPKEENPYPAVSEDYAEWARGQMQGVLVAQDSEE